LNFVARATKEEQQIMLHMRTIGLAVTGSLIAVAFMSATATAAAPEFLTTGGAKAKFTISSGAGTLETVLIEGKHKTLTCTADSGKGKIASAKVAEIEELAFSGCKSEGVSCKTPGDAAGVILVNGATTGTLGFIKEGAPLEVGLLIKLAQNVKFECALLKAEVTGAVIGLIPNAELNTATKKLKVEFKQAGGVQEPLKFMGGVKESLESSFTGIFVQSGLSTNETLEMTEAGVTVTVDG
jgi:hypothetical protein